MRATDRFDDVLLEGRLGGSDGKGELLKDEPDTGGVCMTNHHLPRDGRSAKAKGRSVKELPGTAGKIAAGQESGGIIRRNSGSKEKKKDNHIQET